MIECNCELCKLIEKVLATPFIKLDVDFDIEIDNLLKEYKSLEEKYSMVSYHTKYRGVKKKYARSWTGIALISSDGSLYNDLHNGERPPITSKETVLKNECPYFFDLIKKLGANEGFSGNGSHANIMRIHPDESLVWHSHFEEHGQKKWHLTVQVPIIVPKEFEYCVVDRDEFRWYKRFWKPNWFKNVSRKRLEVGNAYIFNSYHYHNVYNYSDDEYRVSLILNLDLRIPEVFELVKRSIEKQNENLSVYSKNHLHIT